MDGRLSHSVYIEMSDLGPDDYIAGFTERIELASKPSHSSVWRNLRVSREDYRSTDPDFTTLAVHEVDRNFKSVAPDPSVRGSLFHRCPRPPQGRLSPKPTIGLLLCLVSPKTEQGKQALRDWADLIHISAIAGAGIDGFSMITAYENDHAVTPRFAHVYEMDCEDPEAAFQKMAPDTIKRRLGPPGTPEFKAWFGHEQLEINYINTFSLVKAF